MSAEGDDLCGANVLCAAYFMADQEFRVCTLVKGHDGSHSTERFHSAEYLEDSALD
jgi:hypothetical protein